MKTSNLAIVFTDIKGFTERTGRQTHDENRRMLRVHENLMLPVFRAFGGRMVKTIGDAFLVVFPSPTRAVLCGTAIQDRLWDYNRRVREEKGIHVRIAVNMGEVREERGDVFGEPVNIAARVEGLAEAGEVLFTEAVYLSMNKAEVPSEDRGVHSLRGVADRVRVYRVPPGGYRLEAMGSRPAGLPSREAAREIVVHATDAGQDVPLPDMPPYGGLGLSRIPPLPPPDPVQLERAGDLVPQLLAATSDFASRASRLAHKVNALPGTESRMMAGLRVLPGRVRALRGVQLAGLVALTVLLLGAFGALALRGDAVDRALSANDFRGARAAAQQLPEGPARTFAQGRIAEAEGRFPSAAADYGTAARGGDRNAYRRLLRMTDNRSCPARAAAARALGELGNREAIPTLQSLATGSYPDEGEDSALGSIFGCSSRRAARDAIADLHRRGG